jgi:predicted DNA-binding antitoxin AbrB/MazE fold protein
MQSVKVVYEGGAFSPVSPVRLSANQTVMINIPDEIAAKSDKNGWKQFIGALSHETCAELSEILKDTERVDADEW